MWIRRNKMLGKILLLLVTLLVGGMTTLGCIGINLTPEGGSGGTVDNEVLYLCPTVKSPGGFSCSAPETEGKLIAVSTLGSYLWEAPIESSKPAGGFGCAASTPSSGAIYGAPAVEAGLVYIGGYNGKIYAFNSSSGALRWVYPRQGNLQPIVGGAALAVGKVYIGCSDKKLYALDATTGNKEWEFQTGDKIWATPAIDGDTLYIGSFDKKLYALSAADGSEKWEFETEGAIISTPLVYDNTVYIGSFDRHLYAIDATNGSLRWRFMAENWFWARPVACNNTIYAGCLDGKVYVLDAENGRKIAEFDIGSPISSSPVLVDSSIIFASEEGKVYSIDTGNNQKRELKDLGAKVHAPLSASNGVVYIHTNDQNLHALNAQTGLSLWSLPVTSK